ncbi:MAG: hypothetical protein PHZ19_02130 [Candidatus Thermoplasmatota archaeon]|nr:hypothetical protein [Candidatus Thermoplasmatota archaeon]
MPVCRCGSASVVRSGLRYTRRGAVQRWVCLDCGRKFVEHPARVRDEEMVAWGVQRRLMGNSYGAIGRAAGRRKGTVWRWVRHAYYVWYEVAENYKICFRCEVCGWGLDAGENCIRVHAPRRRRRYDVCSLSCLRELLGELGADMVFHRGRGGYVRLTREGRGKTRIPGGLRREQNI